MINEFADSVNAAKVHVVAPTDFVFLCGGQMSNIDQKPPKSLRDAFYKITDFQPLKKASVVRAEDVEILHISRSKYPDLLSFELDLAELAKVTLLFSESHGSLAELGSFCLVPEIAKRMLVLVRSDHFEESSFIKYGIIDFMDDRYADLSYFVLDKNGLKLTGSKVSNETIPELAGMLLDPIKRRLEQIENPTTLDVNKAGHRIKLVVGLLQEFGALTSQEISTLLIAFNLDLSPDEIERYLLCAEAVGWIVRKRKGFRNFAATRDLPRDAANFRFEENTLDATASRRRAERRALIKETEPERFAAIVDGMGQANG